jgi:hypothetical protein
MRVRSPLDAIIVVPPISPSDTNPPLGPYLLRTCFEKARLSLRVCDLSIAYLRAFGLSAQAESAAILGDQDKDRELIGRAKQHFLQVCPLAATSPLALPCCCNAITGMHFSFDDVESAVAAAAQPGHFLHRFVEHELFNGHAPPRVLGLSIMGPPQLFVALVVARMVKQRWPGTLVVAGGSHITLLQEEIAGDSRYGSRIDAFMPGHCERQFVALCSSLRSGGDWREAPGLIVAGVSGGPAACAAGGGFTPVTTSSRSAPGTMNGLPFELLPTFETVDPAPFDPRRATLPMQLSRGCLYRKCTMCTYPVTEPGFSGYPSWGAVGDVIEALIAKHGVRRFSFKDSFMVPKMLRELADLIIKRRMDVEWSATTMLKKELTPHLLSTLAASGCRTLEFGLETLWEAGQKILDKVLPIPTAERVITDTVNAGIVANINLIYGLPDEKLDQAQCQLEWFAFAPEAANLTRFSRHSATVVG